MRYARSIGAISSTSGMGFVTVVGMGTTQWVLENRANKWMNAIGPIVGAILALS